MVDSIHLVLLSLGETEVGRDESFPGTLERVEGGLQKRAQRGGFNLFLSVLFLHLSVRFLLLIQKFLKINTKIIQFNKNIFIYFLDKKKRKFVFSLDEDDNGFALRQLPFL